MYSTVEDKKNISYTVFSSYLEETFALCLDSSRVGCVRELEFYGNVPEGAEHVLIDRLMKEQSSW